MECAWFSPNQNPIQGGSIMDQVAFGMGYGIGWLLGNAIIIVPIGILLYFLLKPKNKSGRKKNV